MLRTANLHVTFNPGTAIANPVLRGISLEIPTGQFMTVIGSHDAGASVLLNTIAGDIPVNSGTIEIDGKDVTHQSPWDRAALVARVFQDPTAGTCEKLSLEENMALAMNRGAARNLSRAINQPMRKLFCERLAILDLGLEKKLADPLASLSGGQRQAVSLLMASLRPSRILLLDEHTAALDPKMAVFMLDLTAKIVAESQLTTIMVTHDLRRALDYGERTVMLHRGRIVLDIAGKQRLGMDVPHLLRLFEKARGETVNDGALLLE